MSAALQAALHHRGPDAGGAWRDDSSGVLLVHRRLSIVDLSAAGSQPMRSADGRYVIVYNGEIYNHQELRDELERSSAISAWRGHSDTETILAAIVAWGLKAALERCVGMFAFALWDRQSRALCLVRDRMGEKPLYYGWRNGGFAFASELKALRTIPGWTSEVDRDALALFMRYGYVPAPHTIDRGVYKLPPGHMLWVPTPAAAAEPPRAYWSAVAAAGRGYDSGRWDDGAAIGELDALLRRSVARQMVADVPLGAFLSGGIDSATVVALMQAQSRTPVKTFTIGFQEKGYNEAADAAAVANHLGTDHTELCVTPADALAVIPSLPTLFDEPFADSSQIPTHLVARLTRQHVTVSLSGDGGDELFAGYNRYVWGASIWRRVGGLPLPLRRVASRMLLGLSPERWDAAFAAVRPCLPRNLRFQTPGRHLHKVASILDAHGPDHLYRRLVSQWPEPARFLAAGSEPPTWAENQMSGVSGLGHAERMMLIDQLSYLPDDILVKVDRAAMGASLETRVPFLDHEVVEFAWRLPLSLKVRGTVGKWLLRQVLYRYVPQSLMERPKSGFAIPLDQWLRGPLREWAEALLDEGRLRRDGYFRADAVRRQWRSHLEGRQNCAAGLWTILMFQAWLEARHG